MTVFLGMPGYGNATAEASRAFWRARRDMSGVVNLYQQGSLLAANFNSLWCHALNLRHRGRPIDYFAMLHDDVGAEEYWLDTLIEEMESRQLDVLGVAVPIKDRRGLTSLALDRPDGDTWSPLCRLHMREVYRLPETFTSDDVGYPLLLNTGCWVCRFDSEWVTQVRFTINDRIAFDRKRDMYVAQTEPEDWYFSRLCHELGLKIGATRKVTVQHTGRTAFSSARPFGDRQWDTDYVQESVIRDGTIVFPEDVAGWLTWQEGLALADLARGKRVLEVGSFFGRSTICLAQTAKEVVSVDPHDGRGTPQPCDTWDQFHDNLRRYDIANVTAHRGTLTPIPDCLLSHAFDLVFIDGTHDVESVRSDIEASCGLLADGGLLVFHDYHDFDPGVKQAVDELLDAGGELVSTHGSLAVVKPPAHTLLEV